MLGRATLGKSAWLGARSVIRADGHYVEIGDDFRLGARGTVHIAHAVLPTHIGSGVTAGVNSVIHACDVGDRCHIGRDVVILDGSNVAAECALADGSIVFPRSVLESGWLYAGSPAKPVRRLMDRELDDLHARSRAAADDHVEEAPWTPHIELPGPLFVACSARLRGRIVAGGENGLWFGCDLDAGELEIRIGSNSNIQDNTIIRVRSRPATIGREFDYRPQCEDGRLLDRRPQPNWHRRRSRAGHDRGKRCSARRRRAHAGRPSPGRRRLLWRLAGSPARAPRRQETCNYCFDLANILSICIEFSAGSGRIVERPRSNFTGDRLTGVAQEGDDGSTFLGDGFRVWANSAIDVLLFGPDFGLVRVKWARQGDLDLQGS